MAKEYKVKRNITYAAILNPGFLLILINFTRDSMKIVAKKMQGNPNVIDQYNSPSTISNKIIKNKVLVAIDFINLSKDKLVLSIIYK